MRIGWYTRSNDVCRYVMVTVIVQDIVYIHIHTYIRALRLCPCPCPCVSYI